MIKRENVGFNPVLPCKQNVKKNTFGFVFNIVVFSGFSNAKQGFMLTAMLVS